MPSTYVGLIRGINVGRAKRVAMSDLRALMERLGCKDCRTLLNSGTMVFDGRGGAGAASIAGRIERAIEGELGVRARVIVFAASDLKTIVAENHLAAASKDPSRLQVVFVRDAAELSRLASLAEEIWAPEALDVGKRAAYLWCPGGVAESPLWAAIGRVLGEDATTRNWATVKKLAALIED